MVEPTAHPQPQPPDLNFLAEASSMLAASLDYETTLARLAQLAVARVADACIVDILAEDGQIRRLAAAHADPAKDELLQELQRRYPPTLHGPHPTAAALRSGAVGLYPAVTDAFLQSIAQDAGHLHLLQALMPRSFIVAPLVARGRTLGALFLIASHPGRQYGPADVVLAAELGQRAALAVDNARLYRQAQEGLRLRDEFLSFLSHELRLPLSHIKGFASTLRQPEVVWDAATQQDFLAEIEREADRLTRLVEGLLDLSRIESGALELSGRRPTAPAALVTAALEQLGAVTDGRAVTVAVAAELPAVVVDEAELVRVLVNLLENAAKYAPPGGAIGVSAAVVDGDLELAVADEGPGIPPAEMERVFERFYRGAPGRQGDVPGTGLGLALCRAIVQAHGGRIWAENRPAGGARVVVRLPLAAIARGSGTPDVPADPGRP